MQRRRWCYYGYYTGSEKGFALLSIFILQILFYMPTGDYWIENIDPEIRYIQIIAADSNTDRQQFDKLGLCIQV